MHEHHRPDTYRATTRGLFSQVRAIAAVGSLCLAGIAVGGCTGPEKVLLNKMYTADISQITVVGDEELTRFNRQGAEASDTSNSAILRFYDGGKIQLFWLGGMGIDGTFEITEASDSGLKASVDIQDGRFSNATASIEPGGQRFELEFDGPIVGWKEGAFSDCSTIVDGKPLCTRNERDIESQTRKVQLTFVGEAG